MADRRGPAETRVRLSPSTRWLGAEGARSVGLAPDAPVVVEAPARPAPGNAALLAAWHDVRAAELVHIGQDWPDPTSAVFSTDGGVRFPSAHEASARRLWHRMLDLLPPLPWGRVQVVWGGQDSPRAYAAPGVVVLGADVDLDSARDVLLYLTHELLHQWAGAATRPPDDAAGRADLEAVVDALAWWLVETELGLGRPFEAMFARYRRVPALAGHGAAVAARVAWLRDGGVELLVAGLGDARPSGGRRATFALPVIPTTRSQMC